MHILMFLSNAFRPDPRVARHARALADHGHQVTIVCWDRQAELPARESYDGIEIIRVQDVPSTYGSGWRQLFYLPRFWRKALRLALELQPDAVHCHDLDTLYVGKQIKKQIGCSLIYDAHEHYPAMMSLYLPSPFVSALVRWERWLMRHVDATITASTVLRDEFLARGVGPVVTLGNYQDLAPYSAVTTAQAAAVRDQLGVSTDDFLVIYIGGFSRNRMLLPLIKAAALLPQVPFHLWGEGRQRSEVEQAAAHQSNVHYHGWLGSDDLPRHFKAADVVYYCLRLDYPGAIYNAPNTLSQAMAAGRPVIANDVGDLGRIVHENQCGLLIGVATPQAIVDAIEQLREPATRVRLGANALQAAESTYNAAVVQRQIIKLYQTLLE